MSEADRERWDARHSAVGAGVPMPPDGLRGRLDLLPGADLPGADRGGVPGVDLSGVDRGGVPDADQAVTPRADRSSLPAGGRALDVACGRGAVAVWLAQQGFLVDALDVSPAGLDSARDLADAEGVEVRFVAADLDDGLPVDGPYDLVVCQRFRDPVLYPALAAALAPGGLLVITVLSEVDDEPGPFRAAPGELRAAFASLEILAHEERNGEATLLAVKP
ncbi:class I SAM-dependent methyltransferase [Pseudonocardia ailaonensis]|uniref:Class I SAM-dependent methyltransferase n=1 Tax=Pseudonocardia ailaonensis TaxID=367279 RepID=A0ABN2MRU1_9PSEU